MGNNKEHAQLELHWSSIVRWLICLEDTPTNSLAEFRWKKIFLGPMTPWRGGRSGTFLTRSFLLLHTIGFFLKGAPITSHKSGRELNSEFPESGDSSLPTGMTVCDFMPFSPGRMCVLLTPDRGEVLRSGRDKSEANEEHTMSKSIHTVQDITSQPLAIIQSVRWITQNWNASLYLLHWRVHRKDVWEPKAF